jgi:hypothetical protein
VLFSPRARPRIHESECLPVVVADDEARRLSSTVHGGGKRRAIIAPVCLGCANPLPLRVFTAETRDTLLSTDRATAVTLDPIGDGKIRVRTSTWDQEVVILALEVVAIGKSLRVVRAPRALEGGGVIFADPRRPVLREVPSVLRPSRNGTAR